MLNLDKLIDDFIAKNRTQKNKIVGVYNPSTVVRCLRQSYYSYLFPKDVSKDTARIFHAGNIIHEFANAVLEQSGFHSVTNERSITLFNLEEGWRINGRLDDSVIVRNEKEDVSYLIEVKSIASVRNMTVPKRQNILQMMPYLFATGIHKGMLWYIEKQSLKSTYFSVDYSEDLLKEFMGRCSLLHKCLKHTIVPQAEYWNDLEMKSLCGEKYCPYWNNCIDDKR